MAGSGAARRPAELVEDPEESSSVSLNRFAHVANLALDGVHRLRLGVEPTIDRGHRAVEPREQVTKESAEVVARRLGHDLITGRRAGARSAARGTRPRARRRSPAAR